METYGRNNDKRRLCPMLNLMRCDYVASCAWKSESGECAITVIAKAIYADQHNDDVYRAERIDVW